MLPPSIVFGSTPGKRYSLTAATSALNEWFGERPDLRRRDG